MAEIEMDLLDATEFPSELWARAVRMGPLPFIIWLRGEDSALATRLTDNISQFLRTLGEIKAILDLSPENGTPTEVEEVGGAVADAGADMADGFDVDNEYAVYGLPHHRYHDQGSNCSKSSSSAASDDSFTSGSSSGSKCGEQGWIRVQPEDGATPFYYNPGSGESMWAVDVDGDDEDDTDESIDGKAQDILPFPCAAGRACGLRLPRRSERRTAWNQRSVLTAEEVRLGDEGDEASLIPIPRYHGNAKPSRTPRSIAPSVAPSVTPSIAAAAAAREHKYWQQSRAGAAGARAGHVHGGVVARPIAQPASFVHVQHPACKKPSYDAPSYAKRVQERRPGGRRQLGRPEPRNRQRPSRPAPSPTRMHDRRATPSWMS